MTLRALSIISDELVRHQLRMIDAPISANDDIAWKQWASMHSKLAPHFEMPDVLTPSSAHVLGAVGHVPHVPSTALAATVPARSGPAASDASGGDAAVAFHSVGLGVAHGTRARSSAAQGGAAGMGPVPVLPGKAAFRIEYVTHGDADSEDRGEAVAASVSPPPVYVAGCWHMSVVQGELAASACAVMKELVCDCTMRLGMDPLRCAAAVLRSPL